MAIVGKNNKTTSGFFEGCHFIVELGVLSQSRKKDIFNSIEVNGGIVDFVISKKVYPLHTFLNIYNKSSMPYTTHSITKHNTKSTCRQLMSSPMKLLSCPTSSRVPVHMAVSWYPRSTSLLVLMLAGVLMNGATLSLGKQYVHYYFYSIYVSISAR